MNSLLRSTPLIINLPVDTEASQEYFEQHLIDNETAFLEAIIIAEKLANVPAIMASSRPISVAVSSSSVIIGISLAQIEQWADEQWGGEPFWFFSLREGHAIPCFPFSLANSKLVKIALTADRREVAQEAPKQEESLDSSCEAIMCEDTEPLTRGQHKTYFITTLRKLFGSVRVKDVKEIIEEFLSEIDSDSFYFDPPRRHALAKALRTKAESAE